MTLLPLLWLIAGVLLVLVLLGVAPGVLLGDVVGGPGPGLGYAMAGLSHPWVTPWLG